MSVYGKQGMTGHGALRKSTEKVDMLEERSNGDIAESSVLLHQKVIFENTPSDYRQSGAPSN